MSLCPVQDLLSLTSPLRCPKDFLLRGRYPANWYWCCAQVLTVEFIEALAQYLARRCKELDIQSPVVEVGAGAALLACSHPKPEAQSRSGAWHMAGTEEPWHQAGGPWMT